MNEKTTQTQSRFAKQLLFFLAMLFCSFGLQAQVTIGAGTAPQKYSILEIVSNKTGGMRLPHLTTAERDALSATIEFKAEDHRGDTNTAVDPGLGLGLTIYNTDVNCIEYWNGYKWVSLCLGTANIVLKSPCGNYNSQNPPIGNADGTPSNCEYTPESKPACMVSSGNAYDVYLIAGSVYATLTVDPLTSAFTVNFSPNNSNLIRNAVVRVVDNCTGEFKDFIFSQAGAICSGYPVPLLNATALDLCTGGSVFAHVTNPQAGVDYIWTYAGVIVHTGNWYEIKRAGVYKVYTEFLGCGEPATLEVTNNSGSDSPSAVTISSTNGGILCSGGNVVLKASTTNPVLWYHDGIPLTEANKNDNPLTLSGAAAAGLWFAAVVDPGGCVSNSSNVLTLIDNTTGGTALPVPEAEVNGQSLTGGGLIICKEGTLKLEVTNATDYPAGTVYEWFDNGVSIAKGSAPLIYLVAPSTTNMTLSVTATDQSGSCPNTTVSQNTAVTFTAPGITAINNGAVQVPICGTTPATLTADNVTGSAYEWMLNGSTITGQTTYTIQATQVGSYTVRYKDGNACWSKVSAATTVIQSAPITMTWNPEPVEAVHKDDALTVSIIANPAATSYQWSYISDNPAAVASISPIGNGSSAVIKFGNQTALPMGTQPYVDVVVKSVGQSCGDASIKWPFQVKDGCTKGTSVSLIPNGNIAMTQNDTRIFTASTNASNNSNDLLYEWFIDNLSQIKSAANTFSYTSTDLGNHTVSVRVTNECTYDVDEVRAQANITVKPNVDQYDPDKTGAFKLTGKDCYDIAQSNFNTICGLQTQRPGDFLDASRNWVEGKQWVYTFVNVNGAAYQNLQFEISDPSVLIKTETSNIAGKTFTLVFDQSVLTKAFNKDRANALTITVYALYEVEGVKKRLELKIKVQDCWCGCGAYIAPGVWKAFMCYNLGADESVGDPFTPSKALHGDYYQWGRSVVAVYGPNAATPYAIGTLNNSAAPVGSWTDTNPMPNNPCPAGWRVPTYDEWQGVITNNIYTIAGSFTTGNLASGSKFGDALFLPASGRYSNGEGLGYGIKDLGINGFYYSSYAARISAGMLYLFYNYRYMNTASSGIHAYSIRCIAE